MKKPSETFFQSDEGWFSTGRTKDRNPKPFRTLRNRGSSTP